MQKHKEWILYAESDLIAAKKLLKPPEVLIPHALFLTQQCAEKSLKAFLFFHKRDPGKIHDLANLIKQCIAVDSEFSKFLQHATDLNPYVQGTRYPDSHLLIPDTSIAEYSIKCAQEILDFVKDKIY
jgi:HEPN domain-containing protein